MELFKNLLIDKCTPLDTNLRSVDKMFLWICFVCSSVS